MTTTLQNLIDDARVEARDTAAPQLWSDADWTKYANDAQVDACRRAHLITDSTTDNDGAATPAPVCLYPLTLNQQIVVLHPSIIHVLRAQLVSQAIPLPVARREDADLIRPGWDLETPNGDDVIAWCPNYQKGRLALIPMTPAIDSLRLTVLRAPLFRMRLASTGPTLAAIDLEIDDVYREGIVLGMLMRAYRKPGTETFQPAAAKDHEDRFTAEFGPARSALVEQWYRDHPSDDTDGTF